jgi:hypothetical protein
MGLDITVYQHAELLEGNHEAIDACWDLEGDDPKYHEHLYLADGFEDSQKGLRPLVRPYGEVFGFRAGSYSGYNEWRGVLCQAILGVSDQELWDDPLKYQDQPFYELINFSDCEGAIGSVAARKLYGDFVDNENKFISYVGGLDDGEYLITKYQDWKHAFDLAREDGVVTFH